VIWRRAGILAFETKSHGRQYRVPSNIAEGAERNSRPEFRLFVGYARGSAGELRTQIMIGQELGHIEPATAERMIAESREISRMLFGLLRSLE